MNGFFPPFDPRSPLFPMSYFGILGPFSWLGAGYSDETRVPAHAIDVSAYQQKLDALYSGYKSRLITELEAVRQGGTLNIEAEAREDRIETEMDRIASPAFKNSCRFASRMRLTHEETQGRGRNRIFINEESPLEHRLLKQNGKNYLSPEGFSKGVWYFWSPDQFCRVDEAGRIRSLTYSGLLLGGSFSKADWQAVEGMFQFALASEESYLAQRFFERFHRSSPVLSSYAAERADATTSVSEFQETEICLEENIESFDEDRRVYVCADGTFLPEENLSSADGPFLEVEWQAWLEYGKAWLNSSAMKTVVHGLGEGLTQFLDAGREENEGSLEDFENE